MNATTTRTIGVVLPPKETPPPAPPPSHPASQTPCGQSSLTAGGYFFSSEKDDAEYSAQGYLEYHFQLLPYYQTGRSFRLMWIYYSDDCSSSGPLYENSSLGLSLPSGHVNMSVRFTSRTHFDVWDDETDTIIASQDLSTQLPPYAGIGFYGSIDAGASELRTRGLKIYENGSAPSFSDSASTPEGCPSISVDGYLFDPYQRTEYVNGLLRMHLRLRTPYNDGRSFRAAVLSGSTCQLLQPGWNMLERSASIPAYQRYFSLRMTSPTQWVLWDDENDSPLPFSGEIPSDTSFVAFYGSIDVDASTMRTAPYPPTSQ